MSVMISQIMVTLDKTIVNVSLPHMQASLGADQNFPAPGPRVAAKSQGIERRLSSCSSGIAVGYSPWPKGGLLMITHRLSLAAMVLLGLVESASAFEISSSSVSDGKWDQKYIADKAGGCDGQNLSIALSWRDPPVGTKSYMMTMFDPDALGGGMGWWHWQVWNIPASATGLPEGAGSKNGKGLPKGAIQGKGDLGRAGYLGPCPTLGSGVHHYVINLYALKAGKLETENGATPTMMTADAMRDSLGKATVTYTFSR
jgi:Raf kinase inhibitor-like YbhB/YbcL family protein